MDATETAYVMGLNPEPRIKRLDALFKRFPGISEKYGAIISAYTLCCVNRGVPPSASKVHMVMHYHSCKDCQAAVVDLLRRKKEADLLKKREGSHG
ncbi:MAG: hypothetical protein WCW77_05210 [Patescibacteria group bacterium]|jgi:hypothetical protein